MTNLVDIVTAEREFTTVLWETIPVEELTEFVMGRHSRGGVTDRYWHQGAVKVQADQPPIPHFPEWAAQMFEDIGIRDIVSTEYWTGYYDDNCPAGQPGFVSGMPHQHGWDGSRGQKLGHTLVMYVQVPEKGGELVVRSDIVDEFEMTPEVGVGAIMTGNIEHGVRPIAGKTPRLSVIATAFQEGR